MTFPREGKLPQAIFASKDIMGIAMTIVFLVRQGS